MTRLSLLFIAVFTFVLQAKTVMRTPTEFVDIETIKFEDDLNFRHMELAIERQLKALERRPIAGKVIMGGKAYSGQRLLLTLKMFREDLKNVQMCMESETKSTCLEDFNRALKQKYIAYRPLKKRNDGYDYVRMTAYYTPTLKGALKKSKQYPWGIYRKPNRDDLRRKTRNQIWFDGALENRGLDVFYVDNIFDYYVLSFEGGGRIKLREEDGGGYHYLSFEGSNGHKFRFIGKYLKERGHITNLSMDSQREFVESHPHFWREIFAYTPNNVYFKRTDDEPAGLENIPLTVGRSIAQDTKYYPRKGLLSFISGRRPYYSNEGKVEWKDFSRFFIDQDTGSAIKGEARVDLYMGMDKEAELAAHNVNNKGQLTFLIAK